MCSWTCVFDFDLITDSLHPSQACLMKAEVCAVAVWFMLAVGVQAT